MKNAINYYYELYPEDIRQIKDYYVFKVENVSYFFLPYKRKIEEIDKIYNWTTDLYNLKMYIHEIVLNKMNNKVTLINNHPYVLLRAHYNDHSLIILDDILQFQKKTHYPIKDKFTVSKIYNLWIQKVDYFEYQVSQFGTNFPYIKNSFNYFIGLAENAISLLNVIDEKNIISFYAHYRMKIRSTIFDLYNPLEFIVDSRIRDCVEYFKNKSLYQDCFDEILYYLKYQQLNKDEALLFFARFLFPTFYFDIYENIVDKKIPENKIKVAIDFIPKYEQNLRQLYFLLKSYYEFPQIEWIIQMNYPN